MDHKSNQLLRPPDWSENNRKNDEAGEMETKTRNAEFSVNSFPD